MNKAIWWKGANKPITHAMDDRCEVCHADHCKILHGVIENKFMHKILCYTHAKEYHKMHDFYGCGCGG